MPTGHIHQYTCSTVYLTIPKEKAANIICEELSKTPSTSHKKTVYSVSNPEESRIELNFKYKGNEYYAAALYDYTLPTHVAESELGRSEEGILGTEHYYRTGDGSRRESTGKATREAVSEYII